MAHLVGKRNMLAVTVRRRFKRLRETLRLTNKGIGDESISVNKYEEQNEFNETIQAEQSREEEETELKVDSIALASKERDEQGTLEVEISYGGEPDLASHFNSCQKHQGHLDFVPVSQFSSEFLPVDYQYQLLEECIKALADLTVRVTVSQVSPHRPSVYPGSARSYPTYKNRQAKLVRLGTGWVEKVVVFPTKKVKKSCSCPRCLVATEPNKIYAHILIRTSSLLVFDEMEARSTTCHLFYDTVGALEMSPEAVSLAGMSKVVSDVSSGTCLMTYVTHDVDLARKLRKVCKQRETAHSTLMDEFNNDLLHRIGESRKSGNRVRSEPTLAVIVSHPHGCSKQVSVGHYQERHMVLPVWTSYTYDTSTCCGCTGAPVYLLGNSQLVFDHAHVGVSERDGSLGYSSHGLD